MQRIGLVQHEGAIYENVELARIAVETVRKVVVDASPEPDIATEYPVEPIKLPTVIDPICAKALCTTECAVEQDQPCVAAQLENPCSSPDRSSLL
jgi:hypothetical protein